jgi:hypothetical protein
VESQPANAAAPSAKHAAPQIRQLLGYIWAKQFFYTRAMPAAVTGFSNRKNAPQKHIFALGKPSEHYSSHQHVAILWKHGPSMLEKMQNRHIPWPQPQLSESDMANPIAYLNSR